MIPELLIDVCGLRIGAKGQPAIVEGLGFQLSPGKCVALVGESGAGKSLTARSLIGLIPAGLTSSADRFTLLGHDARQLAEPEWRALRGKEIGYVLQDALTSLDPLRSIGDEVEETLWAHRLGALAERKSQVLATLTAVGMPEPEIRAQQTAAQLSGGLRQRALIASAIVAGPRIVIADEPTTALDVTVQAQVLAQLAALRASGTGLVLVSHDLAVVAEIADEILVLRHGKVVEQGLPSEVLRRPAHDYTRQLINAVPRASNRGQRLGKRPPLRLTLPIGTDQSAAEDKGGATTPVLSARGLFKSYARGSASPIAAVKEVSFDIAPGEVLGLVGESGSGKTTVARILLGHVQPDRGDALLFGEPWTGLHERQRRARRGLLQHVPQDPYSSFDPRARVSDILTEALRAAKAPAEQAKDLLAAVQLDDSFLPRRPRDLSGGQRQRIAIARALASKPRLLICDEPVSALDVSIQAEILDLLSDLRRQTGISILFISHDLAVVQHICDRVVVMQHGQIVEDGPVSRVFAAPQADYTRTLIASIPQALPLPASAPAVALA